MKAEIISVGTELLMGDCINTNAAFIARGLKGIGISVYHQSVVGDNPARLKDALNLACARSDTVILTGGLGPTQDDLTKETVAEFLNLSLVYDESIWDGIIQTFKKRGRSLTENNKKQAFIPVGAIVLNNPHGTAPGIYLTANDTNFYLLPGPPHEMEPMFTNEVISILSAKSNTRFYNKTLRVCGIGESAAEELLKEIITSQQNPTVAPYAKVGEVHFRVTASAPDTDIARALSRPVIEKIYGILKDNIYGEDDVTLEEAVISSLRKMNMTVSTAESCTGGLIAARLVNVPGASDVFVEGVVAYSNESKIKRLGVSAETLEKYGAVSRETAYEMARGAALGQNANIGLSVTGIAGPDGGSADKPVGLVFIGIYINGNITVNEYHFTGIRQRVREMAAQTALDLLRRSLWQQKQE